MCDDSWDVNDANVVCQQLGYRGAVTAHQSAHFGHGSGQILLDDLECTGREASLLECSHSGINEHNCEHSEDASVTRECDLCLNASTIGMIDPLPIIQCSHKMCRYHIKVFK